MTKDHRYKADVRAVQAGTGVSYLVARRHIADLAEVMQQHPQLGDFGIGVFDPWHKTAEQRRAEFAVNRERLAGSVPAVMETIAWLDENIMPIKTPTVSSYSVKHLMERAARRYVTNGVFIAAALIADYPFKYDQPNVLFGMSERDLRRFR